MKFKTFRQKLNESVCTLFEASNLAANELYKYGWRVDKFLELYKSGGEFETLDGEFVVLKYTPENEKRILQKDNPNAIKFETEDGSFITLGKLKKNATFGGGGGGSGAGSALTDLAESGQCYYAAAIWRKPKTVFSEADLRAAAKTVQASSTIDEVLENLTPDWVASEILGARKLYSLYGHNKYVFHRGSEIVNLIENKFKQLNKEEKAFTNVNKWTPADIWLVAKGFDIHSIIDYAKSLKELNDSLYDALNEENLIGVSLKKMSKSCKHKYVNFDEVKQPIIFSKYTVNKKKFFDSKYITIEFNDNQSIQFRTVLAWSGFCGEIQGKNAQHGKVGMGPINKVLNSIGAIQLPTEASLRAECENMTADILADFYKLYKKFSDDKTKMSFADFVSQLKEKEDPGIYLLSKYLGLRLINELNKIKKNDEFISGCVSYASSSSELSAPFLKLE